MTKEASQLDGNYAAFGKVISGLDVLEKIENVKTDSNDKPKEDVVIKSISVDTKGVTYKEPNKK
jgi:peptidyl-prolyl cis-trans isomerase B (cyclophilin B)